jgi:ribosomal protein L11 methyltransferase
MPPRPSLWKIKITCPPDQVEGLETLWEENALAITSFAPPRHATAEIEAIFAEEPDAVAINTKIAVYAAMQGILLPNAEITEIADLDWLKKVAEDFPPLPIGPWTVYGATYKDGMKDKPLALQIDATSAFGTGEHPTTKGCLLMLARLLKRAKPRNMLDVGCGSGILAMAYVKKGHGKALAVDLDPDSVRIAAENARVNGLSAHMHIARSFGYRNPIIQAKAPYDLIMANIFARPLCAMAKDLKAHLAPNGYAILAGLLNGQANAVLSAHRVQGLKRVEKLRLGEWTILVLQNGQIRR